MRNGEGRRASCHRCIEHEDGPFSIPAYLVVTAAITTMRWLVSSLNALGRALTAAALELARLALPAFGVVPPEWLMTARRQKTL